MPHPVVVPIPPFTAVREVPLDAQETSYLAASARMLSFSNIFSFIVLRVSKSSKLQSLKMHTKKVNSVGLMSSEFLKNDVCRKLNFKKIKSFLFL